MNESVVWIVGKNSGDKAFGLITSDDRDFEKGWSVFDKHLQYLGTSLTSLTKAEINKIGLTPIRSDTRFLSYAQQGRTRQKRRNGFWFNYDPGASVPELAAHGQVPS